MQVPFSVRKLLLVILILIVDASIFLLLGIGLMAHDDQGVNPERMTTFDHWVNIAFITWILLNGIAFILIAFRILKYYQLRKRDTDSH